MIYSVFFSICKLYNLLYAP